MNDEDATPREAALEAAWTRFEQGRPEAALEQLSGLAHPAPGAPLAALCWLELGDLLRAREALDGASDSPLVDTFERDAARAALHLAAWQIDTARAAYAALVECEPDNPILLERLSLCADLQGDQAQADRLLRAACELDPQLLTLPVRLDRETFLELVDRAVRTLPEPFRAALAEVQVVVDDVPDPQAVDLANLAELGATPPDMLGLFHGPTDLEGGWESALDDGFGLVADAPPTIYLFQRNLERAAPDRETLEREIAVTLFHELAHKLGFDEDEVDAMGLG